MSHPDEPRDAGSPEASRSVPGAAGPPAPDRPQPVDRPDGLLARGTGGLLLDPVFGPYFFGKLLATAGIWVYNIVAAVLMWDLTHSTLAVGAVSVALFLPQLLFAPMSGAQADRGSPKVQLLVGRALVTVVSAILAVLTASGADGLHGAWVLILASSVVGIGFVIGSPAQNALLPSLVRRSELSQAVALNMLPPTVARAGGPVLGTFLLTSAGPAWAFGVASLTNFTYGMVILLLPLTGRVQRARKGEGSVRAGFAYLRSERGMMFLLVATLAVGVGADPVLTLTPALSAGFGQGESLVGTLATAFGTGAGLAYFAVSRIQESRGGRALTAWGLGLLATGMFVAGIAPGAPAALAGLGVAGVGFCWGLTGSTTRIYRRVPESLRGRMMAMWAIAFVGSRPVAAAASGALADATSVGTAFVCVALAVAILGTISHLGATDRSLVPGADETPS